jgi:DNA invertase Pin-like site-specific DNA recombinase
MRKLLFQVTGAFAEFERSMIRQRVHAGLRRAVAKGTRLGRPPIKAEVEQRIREALKGGASIRATAAKFAVSKDTILRVKHPFAASEGASVVAV